MHEIVHQLAEQAKSAIPLGIEVDEWIKQYNHNFARLIVLECADLCDRFQARDVGMQPAECAGAIRKMFGVKE